MTLHRNSVVCAVVVALVSVLGACGSDESSETTDPVPTDAVSEPAETAASTEFEQASEPDPTADDDASADEPTPRPENSGTITIGGATTELGAADFLICETVNPAFDENINIIVALDAEPTQVRIAGDLPDDVNAQVGDIATEIFIEGIDVARDGRTVSGSVDAEGTMIEFAFTC